MLILCTPGLHLLCQIVDLDFDISRLVTKIPTTWEGIQAARQLKQSGIKSLATALFSMEQATGDPCGRSRLYIDFTVCAWAQNRDLQGVSERYRPVLGVSLILCQIQEQQPNTWCLCTSTTVLLPELSAHMGKSLCNTKHRWADYARRGQCIDYSTNVSEETRSYR